MSREDITEMLSDSDLEEMLKGSKDFLATIDEIIKFIPPISSPSKQRALRLLFMDARTASYDICILAESLLRNDSHLFSRALEYSMRLIYETMIDYFYIFESDDSVAQRYLDFLGVVNNKENKEKLKEFKSRYEKTGRGCHWSGKSRADKVNQGVNKQQKTTIKNSDNLKRVFDYLNEQVHGNVIIGYYWDFDKFGEFEYVYRGQIVAGLSILWIFYTISESYCRFTGRGNEVKRFEHYEPYIKNFILRNRHKETTQ